MTENAEVQVDDPSVALERNLDLLLELWRRTRIDWSFAADRLAEAFRRRRALGAADRRFVAETLYGLIRHARRVDEALRAGGVRFGSSAPDRERLVAYLVLEEGLGLRRAAAIAPEVRWEAVAAIDEAIGAERDPARRIARRHSLPDWIARALWREHRDHAEALAAALSQRAPMTLRVNALAGSREEVAASLAKEGIETEPGRLSPWALTARTRANLFGLDAFRRGRFELQDEGSQLLAELAAPPGRALVVDFCAGAGGKTLALAAALGNRGRVVACDIDRRKLAELRRRARRAGVTNVQVVHLERDPAAPLPKPLAKLVGRADRVLVDAPCSGLGALRRNPEARWRLDEGAPERLAAEQLAIATRAAALVRPQGLLVYATCTLLEAENRGVVARLLEKVPSLSTVPVAEVLGEARAAAVSDPEGRHFEVFPDVHGTDGFFAAILRRGVE